MGKDGIKRREDGRERGGRERLAGPTTSSNLSSISCSPTLL